MKLLTSFVGMSLVAASVYATPYYVGENPRPMNNVTLNFADTPTKKEFTGTKTGNIATFELRGDYSPAEHMSVGLGLPFYMADKNAAATGKSRNAIGNASLNFNWNDTLSAKTDDFAWGYSVQADAFLPTSRKIEAVSVASANPTTDLFAFTPKATTGLANVGLFLENETFVGKTNLGAAWVYISSPVTGDAHPKDKNRMAFTWQTGLTWKASQNIAANLEYNTVLLDKASADSMAVDGKTTKFRHAVAPSISGNYEQIIGSIFASMPLDAATRKAQNVAFGANVGYQF